MTLVANATLTLKSPAFNNNGNIPSKYTCDGANISPELNIDNFPKETKSFVLIVDDPDAPNGTFVHWVMWNIPLIKKIEANTFPGVQGRNQNHENSYYGPCPPSGTHHYHFKIYAIDTMLELPVSSNKQDVLKAIDDHILAEGELIGLYKRK
jgi:Raf kinase inhibitor-like YbhB/YbcL family protein